MGEKASDLAASLEAIHTSFIETVDRVTEEQWARLCEENGRTVGQVAHHLVDVFDVVGLFVRALADGSFLAPLTYAMIDARNAAQAEKDHSRAAVLEMLRVAGARASELISGLSDEMLAATGIVIKEAGPMTAENVVHLLMVAHERVHLSSIEEALQKSGIRGA